MVTLTGVVKSIDSGLLGNIGQRPGVQLAAGAGSLLIAANWLKEGLWLAGLGLRSQWTTCIQPGLLLGGQIRCPARLLKG